MRRRLKPRETLGLAPGSMPARAGYALFVLLACTVSSPAWASYSEGFATLMLFYVGVMVGAVAILVSLVLCVFGIFRNKAAFVTYFLLASTGAGFIALIACFDTHGAAFLIAEASALVLLAIVVAPASVQYGLHRRRLRVERDPAPDPNAPTLEEIIARSAGGRGVE